jgi:hypothetical protein
MPSSKNRIETEISVFTTGVEVAKHNLDKVIESVTKSLDAIKAKSKFPNLFNDIIDQTAKAKKSVAGLENSIDSLLKKANTKINRQAWIPKTNKWYRSYLGATHFSRNQ